MADWIKKLYEQLLHSLDDVLDVKTKRLNFLMQFFFLGHHQTSF